MTRPEPSSRLLLIADRPGGVTSAPTGIRRYRLARVRFGERPRGGAERYAHLKRTFD